METVTTGNITIQISTIAYLVILLVGFVLAFYYILERKKELNEDFKALDWATKEFMKIDKENLRQVFTVLIDDYVVYKHRQITTHFLLCICKDKGTTEVFVEVVNKAMEKPSADVSDSNLKATNRLQLVATINRLVRLLKEVEEIRSNPCYPFPPVSDVVITATK